MALPGENKQEEENDFFDYAGDILAAPFRGMEGAVQGAYNLADYLAFDILPDYDTRFLGTSKTMAGGAVEGISQFATGFIPLFGLAGRAGALAKAGTVTKGVVAGAATDFTFFNGQEARLSNLIQQVPELQNPVTEFLAHDEDEGELEGRMKNVLEGLGLEAVAGVFIKSLKAIKNGRDVKAKGGNAEQQAQAVVDTGLQQDLASIARGPELIDEFDRDIIDEWFEHLDMEASHDEVLGALDQFKPKYRSFLKALAKEDWLGFDYPSQAVDEFVRNPNIYEQFEISPPLKGAATKLVNAGFRGDIAEPGLSRRSGIFAGRIDDKTKDFLLKGAQAEESGQQAPTIGKTLDQLAVNADTSEVQNLAKNLKKIIKDEDDLNVAVNYKPDVEGDPTTVRGDVGDKGSIAGVYKPSTDRVELYGRADEQTIVHEMLHGVTAKKINSWVSQGGKERSTVLSNIDNVINNKAAPKPIRELAKSFKIASEKVGKEYEFKGADPFDPEGAKGMYGFKDLDEFLVAAFTDLELQRILRRIPADDQRNIFQKIVDAVAELIGTVRGKEGSNLLDKVLRDSAQIISASRGSYMGKAKLVAEGRYYQEVSKFGKSVTSSELDEFRTQQKIPEIKLRKTGAHPTQIATTKATYEKVKAQLKEGSTIDFGAGKNIAVKAGIKADSFEPFPEKGFEPTFKDSSKIASNSYDNVINNAVLNVVPQDIRDNLVSEIGRILKVGGKAFINVRGKDVFDSKHTLISKENMEVIVDSTGAYQKGFTKEELVGYLSEVLGDGFDVKVSTKFGTIAAEVTKRADEGLASVKRPSDLPDFKKGKEDEFLSAIPEKFRGYAEDLMKPGASVPRLPQFALETDGDVVVLKDLLEKYYEANPDKVTVEGAITEIDAEIEQGLMLQEGKDAATKVSEARIVQQSLRDQANGVIENLKNAVNEYDGAGGGTAAIAKLKNNFQQLLSVADVYRKLGREGSLLLGSRRENYGKRKIGLSESDLQIEGIRNAFINASGGMHPDKLVKLIQETIDEGNPDSMLASMFKIAKKAQGKHFLDMPTEYWMNAILSGPRTQMVNIIGNGLTQVMSTLEAVVGGVASGNLSVVKAVLASWSNGQMWGEAAKFAKKAFKQNDNLLDPQNRAFSDRKQGAITGERIAESKLGGMVAEKGLTSKKSLDAFGNFIRLPSRLLLTTDEFFKQLSYRRAARLKAAMSGIQQGIKDPKKLAEHIHNTLEGVVTEGGRIASEEGLYREGVEAANKKGLKGSDRDEFAIKYSKDNFDKTNSALMQYALDEAQYLTFTRDLQDGTLGKVLQDATSKLPMLRLVLPFVRTPTNILKYAFERTPGVFVLKEERGRLISDLKSGDPVRRSQAVGKMMTSVTVAGVFIDTVFNNREYITGGGPRDPKQKKALEATGWRPYSIKIGDTYYSYQRLDPLATLIGVGADLVEAGVRDPKGFDQSGLERLFLALTLSFTRNATNKSYLAGIQSATDALSDPDRYMARFGRNFASSFVPNIISQMADYDTQSLKEVRSMGDAFAKKLGARGGLDKKRNLLGEEYIAEQWMGTGFINPIAMSSVKDDPVLTEMANLNHAFRPSSPNLGGQINLIDHENASGQTAYDRQAELLKDVKIGGRTLRSSLQRLIKSRPYQKLEQTSEPGFPSPRIEEINKVLRSYKKEAKKQMLTEFPELASQYNKALKARAGLRGGMQREDVLELLQQTN